MNELVSDTVFTKPVNRMR